MHCHKNASLTVGDRLWLIERIDPCGMCRRDQHSDRLLMEKALCHAGTEGSIDHSSRPLRTRTTADIEWAQRIERLRSVPTRHIDQGFGRSVVTISRVLAQLGLFRLNAMDPKAPVGRYAHEAPWRPIAYGYDNSGAWQCRVTASQKIRATVRVGLAGDSDGGALARSHSFISSGTGGR